MNGSRDAIADEVVWTSQSSAYELTRPLNMDFDTHYPDVTFRSHRVNGRALTLREYHDVEVLWYNYGIYVLDASGAPIKSLCYLYGDAPPVESLRVDTPRTLPGVTAAIMHWVPGNYCHIVCEHLPLLQALSEAGQLGRVNYLLHDRWAANLVRDAREIYETGAEAIGVDQTGHVRCATLLAFEPINHPAHWGHDVMQRFFDRIRNRAQPAKPYRRLIVTRPLGRRGFANFPDLSAALPDFDVVSLDKPMSLYDQARLFAEAEIIVCGHGAALTNLVFMQPKTGIVEIFNHNYGMATYWVLAKARDLNYCASIDIRGSVLSDTSRKNDDIIVNVPDVVNSVYILKNIRSSANA